MASFQSMAQEAQSMSAMVSFGEKMQKVFGNDMQPGGAASVNGYVTQGPQGPDTESPCNDSDSRLKRLEDVVTKFVEGQGSSSSLP
eukprot:12149939-Karenia_brevis.AAC.1